MEKPALTLSKALEGYFIAASARRLSPATLEDYDRTFTRFQQFLGRDPPLETITAQDIREYLASLDGLSAKTLLNHHIALSALWTWACANRLATDHIVRRVDAPRPARREIIPYTEAEIKALLAACDHSRAYIRPGKRKCVHTRPTCQRDRAIILLLLDTGIRATELCTLTLATLDLKNQRLTVMGKGRKERTLPICPRTAQEIWRYHTTRDNARPRDPVFSTRTGRPMDRHNLRHMLVGAGKRAGVPGVTVHRFRHTFAINFLRNGGNIFALQRILGHATLDMVQRYLAIAQTDIDQAHREASPVANWLL
jgi:site-specific recombinase XerD